MELIAADGTLAAHLADDSHTYQETRLDPGVYLSRGHGHAQLVGVNQRSLVVADLGGVIQIAGIDVADPEHLAVLGDYFQRLAVAFRARRQPAALHDRACPTPDYPDPRTN